MKYFVAITTDGKEFMYRSSSAHAVPMKKAGVICAMLNKARYKLKEGEKWYLYADESSEPYTEIQRFGFRKGRLMDIAT